MCMYLNRVVRSDNPFENMLTPFHSLESNLWEAAHWMDIYSTSKNVGF